MGIGNAINANSTGLVRYNGTGTFDAVTTTQHDILLGAASNGITNLAPSATTGTPLISAGASADPAFSTTFAINDTNGTATITGNTHSVVPGFYVNNTDTVGTAIVSSVATGTANAGFFSSGQSGTTKYWNFGQNPTASTPSNGFNVSFSSGQGDPSTGTVVISCATTGNVNFPTSISLAGGTALSSYVEGTFTPVLAFGGASTGITYSTQVGKYTRIGNIIYFSIGIALSSKGSSTGGATITGLPVNSGGTVLPAGSIEVQTGITFTALYTFAGLNVSSSPTQINLLQFGSGQSEASLADTAFTNSSSFRITGFYFTN